MKAFKELEVNVELASESGDKEDADAADAIEQIDFDALMQSGQLKSESIEDMIILPPHQ